MRKRQSLALISISVFALCSLLTACNKKSDTMSEMEPSAYDTIIVEDSDIAKFKEDTEQAATEAIAEATTEATTETSPEAITEAITETATETAIETAAKEDKTATTTDQQQQDPPEITEPATEAKPSDPPQIQPTQTQPPTTQPSVTDLPPTESPAANPPSPPAYSTRGYYNPDTGTYYSASNTMYFADFGNIPIPDVVYNTNHTHITIQQTYGECWEAWAEPGDGHLYNWAYTGDYVIYVDPEWW